MAVLPVQISANVKRDHSALEKVAMAFQIANQALGLGLAIPKHLEEKRRTKAVESRAEAQDAATASYRKKQLGFSQSRSDIAQSKYDETVTPASPEDQAWMQTQKGAQPGHEYTIAEVKAFRTRSPGIQVQLGGQAATKTERNQKRFDARYNKLEDDVERVENFYKERFIKSKDALQQAQAGTSISSSAAAVAFGRASGDQRISDQDIKRYMPDSSYGLRQKVANWINSKSATPLSPEINQDLIDAISRSLNLSSSERVLDLANVLDRASAKKDFWEHEDVQNYVAKIKRVYPTVENALDNLELRDYQKDYDQDHPKWKQIQEQIEYNTAQIGG